MSKIYVSRFCFSENGDPPIKELETGPSMERSVIDPMSIDESNQPLVEDDKIGC